ncbi:hypothetical protein [Pelagibaculum spongiae]|uniref:Uncharacterized protein n=1 Tax=Pelagibaculum spongiae TaxID=2080658 RepID=A0A2V1GT09_9GAMM|nr:hypothetical protein [Pelagibaculum spongiae]PVZ64503.1 hypothetical protein DC094_19515 [Pelagibaculum spongiae]
MDLFSNRILNFHKGFLPNNGAYLLPIWIWDVAAPDQTKKLNVLEKTILQLIYANKTDLDDIADFMGLEAELIRYIYAGQLMPNGMIDSKGKITDKGKAAISSEDTGYKSLTTAYIFQNAIDGSLLPNISYDVPELDVQPEQYGDLLKFRVRRDKDFQTKAFTLKAEMELPKEPSFQQLVDLITKHNDLIHNLQVRGEFESNTRGFADDDIEVLNEEPRRAYLLNWVVEDQDQVWSTTDPFALVKTSEHCREIVFSQFKKNAGFARHSQPIIGVIKEQETYQQMQERLVASVDFTQFVEYSNAPKIPNLEPILGAFLRRKQSLEEHENKSTIRYENCDDLILQCQKLFECCFKWQLVEWPVANHNFIGKGWEYKDIHEALSNIFGSGLSSQALDNLSKVKSGAIFHAATSKEKNVSVRPLIAAALFSLPANPEHPLCQLNPDDLRIDQILAVAEARNKVAHASDKQTTKNTALMYADFTSEWLKKLLNLMD